MSIALVAVVWLLLGVIFCLVYGRGRLRGDDTAPEPEAPAAAREFASFAVHEWALAAHTISTDELLSTHPDVIQRVATQ